MTDDKSYMLYEIEQMYDSITTLTQEEWFDFFRILYEAETRYLLDFSKVVGSVTMYNYNKWKESK